MVSEPPGLGPARQTDAPVMVQWRDVTAGDVRIANWMGAFREPDAELELFLCSCGVPGCETSGYVRAFRIADHLFFAETPSRYFEPDAHVTTTPPHWINRHGAAVFTRDVWERWSASIEDPLAPFDAFQLPTRADLLVAWLFPTPWASSPQDRPGLEHWFDNDLLATSGIDTDWARSTLRGLTTWLYEDLATPVEGLTVVTDPLFETLYFGAPAAVPTWSSFDARGSTISAWNAVGIMLPPSTGL